MRSPNSLTRRGALLAAFAVGASGRRAAAQSPAAADAWPALAGQIFDNRPIADGKKILEIEAPYRAEDAALVPITIRTLSPPADTRPIERITLVIDENPSPLAATFTLGPNSF